MAARVTRRQVCERHGQEFGQVQVPHVSGVSDSYWLGACRECEEESRREQEAQEKLATQVAEIEAEAEKRIAADPEHEARIRELANADLMKEIEELIAKHRKEEESQIAARRPEWESFHRDTEWNRVVAEIEQERKAIILRS